MKTDNNIFIAGYTTPDISEIDENITDMRIASAVDCYDGYNLIDSFHTENFQTAYESSIADILTFNATDIIIICRLLQAKIYEYYEYQINPKPVFNDINEVLVFMDFVKFLEYDNISLLSSVCIESNMTSEIITKTKNVVSIKKQIINSIDMLANNYKYNTYIYDFLLNYPSDKIIEWFNKNYMKNRSEILIGLNEES